MANSSREIRRRIKATQNIAKITKAMELVAASKMRKAQAQALSSRSYAVLSSELLSALAAQSDYLKHPLIKRILPEDQKLPTQRILVVLITSDRGLAGALNTNVINKALNLLKLEGLGRFDLITVGKKAADAGRRLRLSVVAAFSGKDRNLSILDAKPIAEIAINDYLAFIYEKVFVVYTDFISTLRQTPNIIQVLPFTNHRSPLTDHDEILFEPNPDEVLEKFLYRAVEFTVFQAMVEAVASEHSARMVAMRNANEAAGDLIDDLFLTYNQARQAGITKELSEISAAKLAMEG
ncbi:MAG: ATP synthase F1 subunit gamma [Candidatus Doudnabacteria bacterium]|nr:ATP synthase F1 subunit gamma [Candidatus Doudnabacteria bacterium]